MTTTPTPSWDQCPIRSWSKVTPARLSSQFVLTLNGPADGTEQVTVDTADGSATDADNDYEPIVGQVVTFACRAQTPRS